jgi:hypothetical protein
MFRSKDLNLLRSSQGQTIRLDLKPQWAPFHLCNLLVMTSKFTSILSRFGKSFMLRLEIAAAFILTLKTVRIPEAELPPRRSSRIRRRSSHHNPWQILSMSDHLTTCRTCSTPGFNSRLDYDDKITRSYYSSVLVCCYPS